MRKIVSRYLRSELWTERVSYEAKKRRRKKKLLDRMIADVP